MTEPMVLEREVGDIRSRRRAAVCCNGLGGLLARTRYGFLQLGHELRRPVGIDHERGTKAEDKQALLRVECNPKVGTTALLRWVAFKFGEFPRSEDVGVDHLGPMKHRKRIVRVGDVEPRRAVAPNQATNAAEERISRGEAAEARPGRSAAATVNKGSDERI